MKVSFQKISTGGQQPPPTRLKVLMKTATGQRLVRKGRFRLLDVLQITTIGMRKILILPKNSGITHIVFL
mgnify:CR=1 FL=1